MTQPQSPIQIMQLLDSSNCGQCGEVTCTAFAAAVFRGQRSLSECPRVDERLLSQSAGEDRSKPDPVELSEREMRERMENMQSRIREIDLSAAAKRVGGYFDGKLLWILILGNQLALDQQGRLHTAIHHNFWVALPVLDYVLHASGVEPAGNWKPMRELPGGGISWSGLFSQRCEKPLKEAADAAPELFAELLQMFYGRKPDSETGADIATILYPLPKVPIMITYWGPEEDLESHLSVLFDANTDKNLSLASLFALGTGLGLMIERLVRTHGGDAAS